MLGEKRRNFLVNFAYFAVITFIVVALVRYAIPMLAPFVIALVIAYLLRPVVRLMRSKLGLKGKAAPMLCVTKAKPQIMAANSAHTLGKTVDFFISGSILLHTPPLAQNSRRMV